MGSELWAVFKPSNCFIYIMLLGIVLTWTPWHRPARGLATLGALCFIAWAVSPAGWWLMRPLETRFPQPSLPDEIAGIIVLGGSVMPPLTIAWRQPALNDQAERLTEAVALARDYSGVPVAFSGGPWASSGDDLSEAAVAEDFFRHMGVTNPLILEDRAGNTYDNVQLLLNVLGNDSDLPWVLVTSAYHMPRAAGLFARTGLAVIPYPVDYRTTAESNGWHVELADGAEGADFAAREWAALAAYYWRGWIETPFPGP